MKTKHIYYLSFLLILIIVSGCNKRDADVFYKHYIVAFLSKQSLAIVPTLPSTEYPAQRGIFMLKSTMDVNFKAPKYNINSTGNEKQKYEALCAEHNDTSYNRTYFFHSEENFVQGTHVYCTDQITNISITSDTDWNANYPAGSPLNENFIFMSCSPDQFLGNNYKKMQDQSIGIEQIDERLKGPFSYLALDNTITIIYGKLPEIDFQKHKLLGWSGVIGWFTPIELPDKTDVKINVEITFADGSVRHLQNYFYDQDNFK